MNNYFLKAIKIYEYFEDNLSKEIFEWKIDSLVSNDDSKFIDRMYELNHKSDIPDFNKYIKNRKGKKIFIMGAGKQGRLDLRALNHAGFDIAGFIDNNTSLQGEFVDGKMIISVGELITKYYNEIVIISNNNYANQFYKQLVELGFSQDNIFYSVDGYIRTLFGDIYFDCPGLICDEDDFVFIDAGACDGETSIRFIEWCKGRYQKIYAFEPTKDGYFIISDRLKTYKNIEIFNCCLWKENTKLTFSTGVNIMGSKILENGKEYVEAKTIDTILSGEKVSFIKMDIEGAELEALKGAEESIKKYKPKLAISLYHNKEDLFNIPLYIKEIVPEYKLYLRHYSNKQWDFILYAI